MAEKRKIQSHRTSHYFLVDGRGTKLPTEVILLEKGCENILALRVTMTLCSLSKKKGNDSMLILLNW